MKTIYLELNEDNIVTAVMEDETPYPYCEVEDDVMLEDVVQSLGLDKYIMKWQDDALVIVEEITDDHLMTQLNDIKEQLTQLQEVVLQIM